MFGFKPNRRVTPDDLGIFNKGIRKEGITRPANLFNRDECRSGYVVAPSGGAINPHIEYAVSDYIEIKPSTVYAWLYIFRMAFYTENKNYISTVNGNSTAISGGTVKTPTTAKYIRMCVTKSRIPSAQFVEGYSLTQYEHGYGSIDRVFLPRSYTRNRWISYPMIDMDISGVFSKNVTIPDSYTAIMASNSTTVYDAYDALVSAYPTYITKTLLCNETSPNALPVYQYRFTPVSPSGTFMHKVLKPKLLILSGAHGNEKAAVWTLYNVMNNICNAWAADPLLEAIRFNFDLIVVPLVNPYGYDNNQRKNYNGVDLERNFPAGWTSGNVEDVAYGGTAPLTEIECQKLNSILLEEAVAPDPTEEMLPTLLGVISFHNGAGESYPFLWAIGKNAFISNIIRNHYQRMDRKWKKDYSTFIDQDYDVFIGHSIGEAPGGSIAYQADYYGIKGALTYEIGEKVSADPATAPFDSNTMTMGYEAFINFLLMFTNELMKYWDKQSNL